MASGMGCRLVKVTQSDSSPLKVTLWKGKPPKVPQAATQA